MYRCHGKKHRKFIRIRNQEENLEEILDQNQKSQKHEMSYRNYLDCKIKIIYTDVEYII